MVLKTIEFTAAIRMPYINIYINDCELLEKQGMIGKELGQSKNDHGNNAGIFYGLILAPKFKYCINVNELGVLSQKLLSKVVIKM